MIVLLAAAMLLLLQANVSAQSVAVGLYNEGNRLYRQGDFSGARKNYEESIALGIVDTRVYYNLGNACFKSGAEGFAVVWYERALRLNPRDEDVLANLKFANAVKKDRDPARSGNAVWRFLVEAYYLPTPDELALILAMSVWGIFALGVWRLWRRPAFYSWLAGALFGVLAFSVSAIWLGFRVNELDNVSNAVVVSTEGTARSAPELNRTAVFIVHEATKVRIERREGDWSLVRLANGLGGWIPNSDLEVI